VLEFELKSEKEKIAVSAWVLHKYLLLMKTILVDIEVNDLLNMKTFYGA
jgi:hypothetical protein